MNKRIIKIFCFLMLLCSCSKTNTSLSSSLLESSSLSSSIVNLTDSSSELDNNIDYSKFNQKIIGTWYVHSSWTGILALNTPIIISEDYEVQVLNVTLSYVGLYENFEDTCLFKNGAGTISFIASSNEEGVLDWGIFDSLGNQDIGVARLEEHISGIQYSYEGKTWPINEIKDFMNTSEELPIYEHTYYYLFTGLSAVYDEEKYCMIDLFGVSENAREDYTNLLIENGYTFDTTESTFYVGYDSKKIYSIKLLQYEDNLSIFIYEYKTLFGEK